MTWILWGIYGAFSLVLVNSFIRANPWGLSFWVLVLAVTPLTAIGTQAGFAKLYQGAPNFLAAWFIGSALSSLAGFLGSMFIFREQANFVNILGISLIIFGSWLLIK